MRRERKEIQNEMNALYIQEQLEYELGCGFGTNQIAAAFESHRQKLYGKMAATYGMTVEEYEALQYEVDEILCDKGIFPFC